MKRILALLLALPAFTTAQERSLLWEISGNGLQKKSYVYGTMHVSEKVSFHLPDAFYDKLLEADIVANESDPETWHELVELMAQQRFSMSTGFYSDFGMKPLHRDQLGTVFVNNNYFSSMLSGIEDGVQADFQENTVLDMFIHQTGRKYQKKTLGLENAQESLISVFQLEEKDIRPSEQNRDALMKLVKGGSFEETMKQYYREKDIYTLDSIYKLIFSKHGHEVMITKRNQVMANSIDSLARKGSVFSAIGAAHLAGKQGVIEMLREKGYTVKPTSDEMTDSGRRKKKMIEDYFPHTGFVPFTEDDKMIAMPLNKNQFRDGYSIGSPDYTNGGVINLKRIPLNDFLAKAEGFNHKAIDSLLYENIPGDIIEKNFITGNGFVAYDVRNVTKTGNAQRYRFYVTPLELIAISMTGNGNYIRQYETSVFDKIALAQPSQNWSPVSPENGRFSAEMPTYRAAYGMRPEARINAEVHAYDAKDKSYYFLTERILDNTNLLEDSGYEQRQIHHEFFRNLDADTTKTSTRSNQFYSESTIGDKKIKLTTVIKGSRYYLLGTVNATDDATQKFFTSFKTHPTAKPEINATYRDTTYSFTVDIPKKANGRLFNKLDKSARFSPDNIFDAGAGYFRLSSENGLAMELQAQKYHRYYNASRDSILPRVRREILGEFQTPESAVEEYDYQYDDYTQASALSEMVGKKGFPESKWQKLVKRETTPYKLLSETVAHDKASDTYTYDAMVSRDNATQAIKYRILIRPDGELTLKTLVDRGYAGDDTFIENTTKSLAFTGEPEVSMYSDKFDQFLEDVMSEEDTIRSSALQSVYSLTVDKTHYDRLQRFLDTFDFSDDEQWAAENLFGKLAKADPKRAVPFLVGYYRNGDATASQQLRILALLSASGVKDRYKTIQDLMEEDLPLSDSPFEIKMLFNTDFAQDIENSRALFPAVLQFVSTEEYRKPVIEFCLALRDKGYISDRKLRNLSKSMLINANSEYKRVANRKRKNSEQLYAGQTEDLIGYIDLLYAQAADKKIAAFLDKCRKLNIPEIDNEFLRLDIVEGKKDRAIFAEALKNPKQQFLAVQLMIGKDDKSYRDDLTDDAIALAAASGSSSGAELPVQLHKQTAQFNDRTVTVYFFETKAAADENGDQEPFLQTVAFFDDGDRIDPNAYYIAYPATLAPAEKRDKQYQSIVEALINGPHERASAEVFESYAPSLMDY